MPKKVKHGKKCIVIYILRIYAGKNRKTKNVPTWGSSFPMWLRFSFFEIFFSKFVKREKLAHFCHALLFSRKVSVIDMIVPINNIIVKVMYQGSLQRFGSCKHKIKCIVTFLMYIRNN